MEVVSLGLLALASSALLSKAKLDSKKKKEAFTDSLFGEVPQQKLPTNAKNFIVNSASLFNPLAAILNTSKTSFSSNGAIPAYTAPNNTTTANLFRSMFTKPTTNGLNIIDDARNEKSATIYRVPTGSVLTQAVNLCENRTPLIKIRKADGTYDVTANCSVFDSNDFAGTCGVCHMNAVNSDGCNVTNNQGLYVSSRMRQDPTEEELQRRMLAENEGGDLSKNLISPTVGKCGSDSVTKKNYFSLNKDVCVATNKFLQCKAGQSFASEGCYACRRNVAGGRSFNFVNSNVGLFSVRQPTTFTLGGRGKVNIELYDENGMTSLDYLHSPNSQGILTLSSNSNDLILNANPPTYKIPLTNGEAAAGKYLVITLSKINTSDPIPYVQGNFYGKLRNKTNPTSPIEDVTDFAQTALDITSLGTNITPLTGNTGSFIYYQNANDGKGMRMQPAIDTELGSQKITAKFKVLIPYLYIDTNNIEATYCDGPFIKNANSSNLLSNNACYDAGSAPGSYNSNCLSNIFVTAGCKVKGSNFPGNAAAIARLNVMGDKGTISSNVNLLFNRAYTGYSANGSQLSDADWLDAQRACFDAETISMNPCLNLSQNVQSNGPLSEQCIQYLYASGRSNDITNNWSNNGPFSAKTYTSNADAKSLFATPNALGLYTGQVKDRYCTENGTISPLNGSSSKAAGITLATSKGGVAALKSFYNNIHMMANKTDLTNAERAQYVLQCYGTTLDVQADSNPTNPNGKDVAATNCGSGGLTIGNIRIGNIRYVKIFGANGQKLRLSQVVVLDARGQNVALKKTVTGAAASSGSLASIVDGSLSLKTSPYISSSNGNGALVNNPAYISIDLDGQYDIVQIIVFNTGVYGEQIGLSGAKAAIYSHVDSNNNGAFKKDDTLTAAPVQYIDIIGTNPSKSCPQMMSGKRGDLLSGTESIANNIQQNINALNNSLKYQRYELGTVGQGTGIDSRGIISTTPVAKWIWNHPYASVNSGTTYVSFYISFENPEQKQTNYELYFNKSGCTIEAEFNNGSFPDGVIIPAQKITVKAVPGINYISFKCTPNPATGPSAFAAYLKDSGGAIIATGAGPASDSSGWICYTQPSIVGAYTYNSGDKTKYELVITGSGRGINATGATTTSPVARWIWNHPYSSVNSGSQDVSFYAKVNNSGTIVRTSKFYYNIVNCSIVITVNKKSLTATAGAGTDVDLVPGDNLINVTCRPTNQHLPTAFAAHIDTYMTGDTGSWFCDTDPSVADINSAATASGIIYKIYDTPAAGWYNDITYANYVENTYSPGSLLTDNSAKWIWNNPEGALAAGSTSANFYYDIDGAEGEGVTYRLYFDKKGTIGIAINGVNYSSSSSGFEFKVFNGRNRISITVTPSSGGQAGFIAYLTNSSGTVANSQTGVTGSLWKSGVATTWSTTSPCSFVSGSNMTYNCANKIFSSNCAPNSNLPVDHYKDTFWNKTITNTNTEVQTNWAARAASSGTQQTACKGMTVCPSGSTYESVSERCWIVPTDTRTPSYDTTTKKFNYSYDPGEWVPHIYRNNLSDCGHNITTNLCGKKTNGSSKSGLKCEGRAGYCVECCTCSDADCGVAGTRHPGSATSDRTYTACSNGYIGDYDSETDKYRCTQNRDPFYTGNLMPVKYMFVYTATGGVPLQIARMLIQNKDNTESTKSSIFNSVGKNGGDLAKLTAKVPANTVWDHRCLDLHNNILPTILNKSKAVLAQSWQSGNLYHSFGVNNNQTGFYVEFSSPEYIKFIDIYGRTDCCEIRIKEISFRFLDKDFNTIVNAERPFRDSNGPYGRFNMPFYNSCETGYTFDDTDAKCKKSVTTTPPQF